MKLANQDVKASILDIDISEAEWCLKYLLDKTSTDSIWDKKFYNCVHQALVEYKKKRSAALYRLIRKKVKDNEKFLEDIDKIARNENRNSYKAQ